MPIPIGLVNGKPENPEISSGLLDVSFLANSLENKEAGNGMMAFADRDAKDIMHIWLHAKKLGKDQFELNDEMGLENKDILRLKSRGLISGGIDKVKFTSRAKTVICTMTLGESNSYLKKRKEKSYSEILASMDKRGKGGYRMAYDENSHLLNLTAQSGDNGDRFKIIYDLMNDLYSHFGTGVVDNNGAYASFEMTDEAMGTCWIQVAYLENRDIIFIDKYYEDEAMDERLGVNAGVDFSFDYEILKSQVISSIEKIK